MRRAFIDWLVRWRVRQQTRAAVREHRRRAQLAACCGQMSSRWLQTNHYQSGQRREH
jgi:hypothetical protein